MLDGAKYFIYFNFSVHVALVRGIHFEKNVTRFGWVMDMSNNFS